MRARLTFAVVGAGATGALLAGRLAEVDVPVTLIARGESLSAVRQDGIRLIGPDGKSRHAHPAVVAAEREPVDPVDVAIFSVKTYDTTEAARALAPLVRDTGYVLCLQNGVENEEILARHVGESRVLPGVLYVGAERLAPGVVSYSIEPRIVFGRAAASDDAPIDGIRDALTAAGIEVEVDPDILAAKWQKFVFSCGLNPLTAVTGQKLGPLFASEDGRKLFTSLVDEALGAAAAAGAPVDERTRENVMDIGRRMDISSSMAEDLAAGRPLELEAFCGYVLRLGSRHGVATPVTDVFYRLLKASNTLGRG